eukprot:366191-Chlamydomonas_euryale.AAC.2
MVKSEDQREEALHRERLSLPFLVIMILRSCAAASRLTRRGSLVILHEGARTREGKRGGVSDRDFPIACI